jgi:hypothetical protein
MSDLRLRALAAADRLGRHLGSLAEEERTALALALRRSRSRGLVGADDRVDVHWLARGQGASAAVGRIDLRGPFGVTMPFGTAFVVGPGVVLTNHHVLSGASVAAGARLVLGHERAVDGSVRSGAVLPLDPDRLYLADPELDYALVGVEGDCPPPLEVRLTPISVQAPLVVIQHPGGEPKQLGMGRCLALSEDEGFVHHDADTRRGSSGAPVFDLSWRVVALHRQAVPRIDEQGRILAQDGSLWTDAMGADAMDVLTNEGALLRAVAAHVAARADSLSADTREQVQLLLSWWAG